MKNRRVCILVCIICVLIFPLISGAQATTDHFSDSMVLVVGKSDTVSSTLLWFFGCKFIINKQVNIQVNGEEDETITACIFPSNVGFYYSHTNMTIHMLGAIGVVFWGQKSVLFPNSPLLVFAFCKARDIWVTYD